jgi:propionyl-CoA synthetase
MGQLALRLPLPPGALNTLWRAPERFHQSYLAHFPGYYDTSDAGMVDADGYVWVMGRTDDVINVAGHRLSTGEMEEVLSGHRDVAECAVIGRADSLKGQVPMGLVVLKAGVNRPQALVCSELVSRVREHIGPVAAFREVHIVNRLPKTRSGKILRATLRKMADGEDVAVPATIDDPAILDEIAAKLRGGD